MHNKAPKLNSTYSTYTKLKHMKEKKQLIYIYITWHPRSGPGSPSAAARPLHVALPPLFRTGFEDRTVRPGTLFQNVASECEAAPIFCSANLSPPPPWGLGSRRGEQKHIFYLKRATRPCSGAQ